MIERTIYNNSGISRENEREREGGRTLRTYLG